MQHTFEANDPIPERWLVAGTEGHFGCKVKVVEDGDEIDIYALELPEEAMLFFPVCGDGGPFKVNCRLFGRGYTPTGAIITA